MERHSMFIGQKTQHFQDISYSPLDLQIQCYWEEFPACHFVDINTVILSFIWEEKKPRMGNTIPKENKIGNLHCSTSSTFVVLSGLALLRMYLYAVFSPLLIFTFSLFLSFPFKLACLSWYGSMLPIISFHQNEPSSFSR